MRPPAVRRAAGRLGTVLAAVALGLAAPAVPAGAHADPVDADPGPGSGLPQAPGAVVMRFTEPLIMELSRIEVRDDAGGEVGQGSTRPVEGDPTAMRRDLGLLPPGQYTVQWVTVSPLDGHTRRGSYQFGIGASGAPGQQVRDGPVDSEGWLGIAGRAVALAGLAVWAGGALAGRAAARAGLPAGRLHRLRQAAPAAAAVGTATSLAAAVLGAAGGAAGLGALLASQSGLLRAVTAAAAVVGVLAAGGGGVGRAVHALAAVVAVAAEASSGHAATAVLPSLAVASFAVHVVAGGVWAFAIAAAALTPHGLAGVLRGLSRHAVIAAAAAALAGAANAAQLLTRPADLAMTGYGRVLAAKTFLVALVAAFGAVHARRRSRGQPARRLRRPLRVEAATLAGVVVLTAVLVAFPDPPRQVEGAVEHAAGDPLIAALDERDALSLGATAGPYVAGLTILPPRPGRVEMRLQLLGSEPGAGLRDARVTARAPSGQTLATALEPCGRGCFQGTQTLAEAGEWTLEAAVASNHGPVGFTLNIPLPAPDGRELFRRGLAAMEQLETAEVREVLREREDGITVRSMYAFAAPDALDWRVEEGSRRIIVDRDMWVRSRPGHPWRHRDYPEPGYRWPHGFYRGFFEDATAFRRLGTDTIDGRRADLLAFVQPAYPAWYRLWVDEANGRILRLEMRAERHVMDQDYGPFNQPVTIHPPDVATTTETK